MDSILMLFCCLYKHCCYFQHDVVKHFSIYSCLHSILVLCQQTLSKPMLYSTFPICCGKLIDLCLEFLIIIFLFGYKCWVQFHSCECIYSTFLTICELLTSYKIDCMQQNIFPSTLHCFISLFHFVLIPYYCDFEDYHMP